MLSRARLALLLAISTGIASAVLTQAVLTQAVLAQDGGVGGGDAGPGADVDAEVSADAGTSTPATGTSAPATASTAPATGGTAPATASASATESPLPPGVGPIRWAPALGRDCHRYSKRRVCEGPRRVPMASDEALARQRALGLDQPRVAHRATTGPVPPEWAAAAPAGDPDDGLLWPVQGGRMWRGFGMHRRIQRTKSGRLRHLRARRRHEGIDIGAHEGTPIVAADHALVAYADNGMGGYGNSLLLVHHDGSVTLYAHCHELYVAAGELVQRGQIIAAVGDTGLAHGAHLHFEWRVDGRVRDPAPAIVGRPEHGAAPEAVAEVEDEHAPAPAP